MVLASGTRLGVYEILAPLGAGGMGEVYRARDAALNRDVAIKVLPEAFAADPDRLMRFTREAQTLAALSHPNVAVIHGIEHFDGGRALVMELVEGDDLSQRIAKGPIPLDEALPIARQIVEGLEAAHEAGIIHRDLKPANIKVRPDGTVKVLDFGLAKAMDRGPGSRDSGPLGATVTSPALTALGLILGTAAYMAPEQARNRAVDKRADIWAFGVVFYEMLTGRRAFDGEDISDLLVAVLSKDVDWQALPASTPPAIVTLLRRCLERDPRSRLRDIGDARHLLDQARDEPEAGVAGARPPFEAATPPRRGAMFALAALALVSMAVAAWALTSGAPRAGVTYVSLPLPDGHVLIDGPAISRDGQQVAFVSSDGIARPQLYVRRLDEPEARLIAGTEDASQPFFSPNGRSLAFYGKQALFKVSLSGGAPVALAPSGSHFGGAWLEDGRIVFSRAWNGGFYTVSENGGRAELLIEPKRPQEYAYVWPLAVPGGRELVFGRWGDAFELVRLDLGTLTQTPITAQWRKSAYAPGYLVFGNDTGAGELWAIQYPGAGGSTAPVTVVEQVDVGNMDGDTRFDISSTGTLAYSSVNRNARSLAVVDMFGRATPMTGVEEGYNSFAVSPDGRGLAGIRLGKLEIVDLGRGTATPFVPELTKGAQSDALWTPAGDRVVFGANFEGNWELYSKAASGAGAVEPVLRRPLDQYPLSYAPDGALLFVEIHPDSGTDLWILPKEGEPTPWLVTKAEEDDARFSPDGQLVAYVSNVSGRSEVYVQTRAAGGGRIQLSVAGGSRPVWSPDGGRVYFRRDNAMLVSSVSARGGLTAGSPEQLFDGGWALGGNSNYSPTPDGKRFLMSQRRPEAIPTRITVVFNWFDELARRMSQR